MKRLIDCLALALVSTACVSNEVFRPSTPADAAAASPLGPSYVLMPIPSDDTGLLGRIVLAPSTDGRSLDEVSRPNECADLLTPEKRGPLASTFEDAQELSAGGHARAALGMFGFEGDAQAATHFYYKLDVVQRAFRADTTEYMTCCREKGSCGFGFVSALVYGEGEYATLSESSAEGNMTITVAGSAGGFVKAKVLHKRKVRGYVAALITTTDPQATQQTVPLLGDLKAIGIQLDEQSLPQQVRARFELAKIRTAIAGQGATEFMYAFSDGNGPVSENEFIRRYEQLTGDLALHDAEHNRRTGAIVGKSIGLALSLGVGIYGVTHVQRDCTADDIADTNTPDCGTRADRTLSVPGLLMTSFGGAGALTFGALLLGDLREADGEPEEHVINKFDAELYVARYNRALLRATVKNTDALMRQLSSEAPRVRVMPLLSLDYFGVQGTF
jgi:hypothetical protein